MPQFLFCFGYETPTQHRNNSAHGWDDEDSHAIFIDAEDADAALSWGCDIAEVFVQRLWTARGESGPSWKDGKFAHWIESDPAEVASAYARGVPRVSVGEHLAG